MFSLLSKDLVVCLDTVNYISRLTDESSINLNLRTVIRGLLTVPGFMKGQVGQFTPQGLIPGIS